MKLLLAWIVSLSIIHASVTEQYLKDDYNQLKHFLFHKKPPSYSPKVIENLIHSTSTRSSSIQVPKAPVYPSSGVCASNPCEHGGICTPDGQTTYDCKCVGPWRGIYCGVADACYHSPCQNGGTCLNVHDDYWCKCPNGYYGINCQTKFQSPNNMNNACRPNICNTGQCVSLETTYYCQCPDDRFGEHCEKRVRKRSISKRQSFYELINQMKRVLHKQDKSREDDDDGRAYYDFKNGIYF